MLASQRSSCGAWEAYQINNLSIDKVGIRILTTNEKICQAAQWGMWITLAEIFSETTNDSLPTLGVVLPKRPFSTLWGTFPPLDGLTTIAADKVKLMAR
ncbi:uncharacterized protein METZ01_LOCUS396215 [marine metagenome]|uniref:Uncharacterized protein n=1 Tax=marine metagenome TaxID=408172 RepID=A0A382VBV3_9ZZZZ